MHKISIGIPTYNDFERVNNCLSSIFLFTPSKFNFKVVVLDDGTPNKEKVLKLKEVCDSFNVPLIQHQENRGIPASWNTLTSHYDDCDIQILFNDDICINNNNWLESVIYFFDNNENVGSLGWNLIQIDPKTGSPNKSYSLPNFDVSPGRVGSPVGCCFAFKRDNWKKVKYQDGSFGFPETYIRSFYEETWFNFEQWKLGLWSFHVPYPSMEHWGSQTFSKNRELSVTKFNSFLSSSEYIEKLKEHKEFMSLPIENHIELADKGFAYRMDYARCIFAKYWNVKDWWQVPQVEVHEKILNINNLPQRNVKYLDKNMQEREALV